MSKDHHSATRPYDQKTEMEYDWYDDERVTRQTLLSICKNLRLPSGTKREMVEGIREYDRAYNLVRDARRDTPVALLIGQ